ncbi:MAG: hypothetical protein ACT4QG_09955 [Sporichthyaceae bacterium]
MRKTIRNIAVATAALAAFGVTMGSANAAETVSLGANVSDSATLSGSSIPSGGSLVFRLYVLQPAPAVQECTSANLVFSDTVAVTGPGTYTSAAFQTVNTGLHQWVATYYSGAEGDGDVLSGGTCPDASEQIVVEGAPNVRTVPGSDTTPPAAAPAEPAPAPAPAPEPVPAPLPTPAPAPAL